ncbi:MAG: TolC family outer membrane protein [Sulfuricurvum sp.]|nr:TolC family outer membrane protein [Sulfuricurvum sp.]
MRILWIGLLLGGSLYALSLEEAVNEALRTHPIVKERLNNFRAIQQDLQIAKAGYLPSLDYRSTTGYNRAGELNNRIRSNYPEYTNYENSLTLTQNLFNGFGTLHQIDYQEVRILAAGYNYIEKTNDVAFRTVGAYLNVLRSKDLYATAQENVAINTELFNKVKELFNGGLTTKSEMNKIQTALSLSKSNLTVQENNIRDTLATLRRMVGHDVDPQSLQKVTLKTPMPESFERAAMIAVDRNPSILVGRYNTKGAQALMGEHKKAYYPKIDLEVSQFYNDAHNNNNGFDQTDDRFRARFILNYNLYRGGADSAEEQKNISKINQEVQTTLISKREALEGIELSWNAYQMIQKQLVDLYDYKKYSETTLELYKDEFDMGRRSLLDLLAAQNDLIGSRQNIINAEHDELYARYRILDMMGLMVVAVLGDDKEYTAQVNIGSGKALIMEDQLPVKLDQDGDMIPDTIDLCDNSKSGESLMLYGCEKAKPLNLDTKAASSPVAPKPASALAVRAVDSDGDGVADENDKCANTPKGYNVDTDGCPKEVTLHINFDSSSYVIPASAGSDIENLRQFMAENKSYKIDIFGHTDSSGEAVPNQVLSENRANALREVLVNEGIAAERMHVYGLGETQPIVSNLLKEGRAQNRRVHIKMNRE